MQDNNVRLPKEIVINILSRLTVKNLLRLKSVCKEWHRLISSSGPDSVNHEHDLRMDQIPYLVAYKRQDQVHDSDAIYNPGATIQFSVIDLLKETVHNRFELQLRRGKRPFIQACHGLVFLMNLRHDYVLNPATREIVELPLPHSPGVVWPKNTIGFGYLPNKNEYKIVSWFKIVSSGSSVHEVGCRILTLTDGVNVKSGTWKVIANRPALPLNIKSGSLCVNGVIYWLSRSRWARIDIEQPKWDDENKKFSCALLSIDLGREEYQLTPCPNFQHRVKFLESGGCLCVGEFPEGYYDYNNTMSFWRFKNNVWEMICSIEPPSDIRPRNRLEPVGGISKAGGSGADDEELLLMTYSSFCTGLLHYNIRSESFGTPEIQVWGYETSFLCYDSLFCLGGE